MKMRSPHQDDAVQNLKANGFAQNIPIQNESKLCETLSGLNLSQCSPGKHKNTSIFAMWGPLDS
jgi:hypothetical protein